MDKLSKDWQELKRLALMSPAHLQLLALSTPGPLPLRSLRWRIHLDLLPAEHFGQEDDECSRVWEAASTKERNNYTTLRQQFLIDPDSLSSSSHSWQGAMHPLSLDEDSPWARYHADQELRSTIALDVARTFPDEDYFRQGRVQQMLGDILFVYAKMHSGLRYRQGMHELLAPILLAVDMDAVSQGDGFLTRILDRKYVEHDAFAMFDRLMRFCAPWYQAPMVGTAVTPLVVQCQGILQKLALVDNELAQHITELDIEPQLFGLRWLRLLFGREVSSLRSLMQLWDALLGDTAGVLRLVDWVGVVLLLANRRALVDADYADCLATLLHLPQLPRPSAETLERTPPLANSPLPSSPLVDCTMAAAQRLPLNALVIPEMTPIQRLALQAAYLRSRPTPESARLIAKQYELWDAESWAVVDTRGESVLPAEAVTISTEQPPIPIPTRLAPEPSAETRPTYTRKAYTSSTLQQQRRAANGAASYGTSPRKATGSAAGGSAHSPPITMMSPESARSPGEVISSIGLLTAQITALAAQCADVLAQKPDEGSLRTVAAALHTVSRVWQDEVSRAPGSTFVRPRAMSDADLRVVLRDLDKLLVGLGK
ncbi:hypothetical protein GGF40_001836 [Coemansia sp. RSA 1286]|nr:hypothetical protein GGF39_001772 [Coemansia sp. RSA 1721]KAJ2638196.1 hypothetical protein GGF40_001836 [Coemansia sp. RSA 1286]